MDLSAEDFEVAEDGVVQKVDSFTRVSRGGGIGVGVAWRSPARSDRRRSDRAQRLAEPPLAAPLRGRDDRARVRSSLVRIASASRSARRSTTSRRAASRAHGSASSLPTLASASSRGTRRTARWCGKPWHESSPSGTSAEEQKAGRGPTSSWHDAAQLRGQNDAVRRRGATGGGRSQLARNVSEIGQRETRAPAWSRPSSTCSARSTTSTATTEATTRHRRCSTVVESLADATRPQDHRVLLGGASGLARALGAGSTPSSTPPTAPTSPPTPIDANGLRTQSTADDMRKKEMDGVRRGALHQLATGSDRTDQPLTMALRARRGHAAARLARRTGAAGRRHGRLPGRETRTICRRRSGASTRTTSSTTCSPTRRRTPRSTASSARFRSRSAGPACRSSRGRDTAPSGARAAWTTASFEAPALALLDARTAAERVPGARRRLQLPGPGAPGPDARAGARSAPTRCASTSIRTGRPTPDRPRSSSGSAMDKGREVQKLSQQYLLSGDAKDVEAARQRRHPLLPRAGSRRPASTRSSRSSSTRCAQQGSARVATLDVPAVPTGRPSA